MNNFLKLIVKNKKNIIIILTFIIFLIGLGFLIYWLIGYTSNIPWNKCIVPYVFSSEFTELEKSKILSYMNIISESSKTNQNDKGIVFIPKTDQIEFVSFNKIQDNAKCGDSLVSKRLGGQTVNLSSNCITERVIIHELMHVLGFAHEQNRKDRDSYVIINYNNIIDGQNNQFDIFNNIVSDNIILKTDYDYKSIMHYPSNAYSKNNNLTIEIKNNQSGIIQQNDVLSYIDKMRLQMYYNLWK